VAEDRLVDLFGLDARSAHRLARGERPQVHRRELGERAEEPADRRASALEDDRGLQRAPV
jgi:hypothetical protein